MRRLGARFFDFWWGQGIADDVPSLAYYLVLSLAPFALGVAALQALLLEDVLSALEVARQINRFLPDALHRDVEQLILGTRDNSPLLLALAVGAMLWTSSGAIGVIERCESRLLASRRHPIVTGRLRNVALGALVAAAFVLGTGSAPVIGEVSATLDLRGDVPDGLLFVLNALGSIALFGVIYRYAPRRRIAWRAAFLGALPAGAAIQAIPWLVGVYFGATAGFAAVRLFLLLAVLLLGLYALATLMLLGVGLAARAELRRRERGGAALADGTPEASSATGRPASRVGRPSAEPCRRPCRGAPGPVASVRLVDRAGLELVEEVVPLRDRELAVLRPRDSEALLDDEAFEREELMPYWAELWPSGVALARVVSTRALRGMRVLEIGCGGLALPSIAAALGGARVLATDWAEDAVALAARNARRNRADVEVARVAWNAPEALVDAAPWDLVLAADVLYERRNLDLLVPLLARLGNETWVADPGRPLLEAFLDRVADRFEADTLADPASPSVTIHRLRRR